MYTIPQFETVLLAIHVQIEEMITVNYNVREVTGYKDGKRLTWNEAGQCFFNKIAMPENDLNFK